MIRSRNYPPISFGGAMKEPSPAKTAELDEWEVRPGGMLVQKRTPDSESAVAAVAAVIPTIRVKVKYDSNYYEIYLSAQSTFGELKKLVAERTGVHHDEQKILYKEKEREGNAYLDVCGVKDKSKLVMVVDPAARAKRVLEMRKAAKLEKAAKSVKDISTQVDSLALQVSNMEVSISKGKKADENDILSLIEQLMTELIKLDGIVVDGDIKLQRGVQVRRVQKYVETLDMLKIKNAKIGSSTTKQQQYQQHQKKQQATQSASVVVTTEWEMFDSLFAASNNSNSVSAASTATSTASTAIAAKSEWELF